MNFGPPLAAATCRLMLSEFNGGPPYCSARQKCLIALHWQGNPGHEHSLYSRGRSLPFERVLPLGQLADVEFVSIQKGAGSEKLQFNKALRFVAGQKNVCQSMDFKDTAAVLANCDLLISSDSAVVHLAGAMGIPTWLAPTVDTGMALGLRRESHTLVRQCLTLPATLRWKLGCRDWRDD